MDYLQYLQQKKRYICKISFKPYYKWITFNTINEEYEFEAKFDSFKPYYKWITFNTQVSVTSGVLTPQF